MKLRRQMYRLLVAQTSPDDQILGNNKDRDKRNLRSTRYPAAYYHVQQFDPAKAQRECSNLIKLQYEFHILLLRHTSI